MEKCKFPGCGYVADFISKVHCRLVHNMEREQVEELYGKGNILKVKFSGKREKWNPTPAQVLEAEANGISEEVLRRRGRKGWRTDDAVKVPVFTQREIAQLGAKAQTWNFKTGVQSLEPRRQEEN